MLRTLRPWMTFVLVLAFAAPAGATTVLKLPLQEMTRKADLVVRAEVRDVQTRLEDGGFRPVATVATFQVLQVLKGQATSPVLRMELAGGRTDKAVFHVPGMPSFRVGEEVVLFLEKTPRGFIPAGLSQGKYTVSRDASGRMRAVREAHDVARVARDAQSGRMVHVHAADAEDDLDLEDLEKAIRSGLQGKGGAR